MMRRLHPMQAALCIAGLVLTFPAHAEHRALLVGINDYSASDLVAEAAHWAERRQELVEHGTARTHWPNLSGAVNDVTTMKEMLTARYGFQAENIHLLTDQAATRRAIFRAIEALVAATSPGDEVLFYYSGHGSQVHSPPTTERDALDESIVPADARLGAPDVRDKELRHLLLPVLERGARLTVVLDSCHSGSGVRGERQGVRGLKPVLETPAVETPLGPSLESRGALILAAAQDFELAYEARDGDGRPFGAFSLALLETLRSSGVHESAGQLFQRLRARLLAARPWQHPVLSAHPDVENRPLFGGRADHRTSATVVAVERVDRTGAVVLQGGWANGLAPGSELRRWSPLDDDADVHRPDSRTTLRVEQVLGLGRSLARALPADSSPPVEEPIQPGDLFEVTSWALPVDQVFRVWISNAEGTEESFARQLAAAARDGHFKWIEDPTEERLDHLLRWRANSWELLTEESTEFLGPEPSTQELIDRFTASSARLFLQLPAPSGLVQALQIGPGTANDAIELVQDPEQAALHLAGRWHRDRLELAWIRPDLLTRPNPEAILPARTDWHQATGPSAGAMVEPLRGTLLRLARLQAWHKLESLANGEFPYRLTFHPAASPRGAPTRGPLQTGLEYEMSLERNPGTSREKRTRYVYVFVIDSWGKSTLLFPRWGDENRVPVSAEQADRRPAEIPLGPGSRFRVRPPFGSDTWFLLTSAEPLPQPNILHFEGVRHRGPRGASPLETILLWTGTPNRGAEPSLQVPVGWEIQRFRRVSVRSHS